MSVVPSENDAYFNQRQLQVLELQKKRLVQINQPTRLERVDDRIPSEDERISDQFSCSQRLNIFCAKCCCFCGYVPLRCPCRKTYRTPEKIMEYERAVVFRFGLLHDDSLLGPGNVDLLTNIDRIEKKVDLREGYCLYENIDLKTLDGTPLGVRAATFFQVTNPVKSVLDVEGADVSKQINNIMNGLIRFAIEKREFWTVLNEKQLIQSDLKEQIKKHTARWGVTVNRVEICEILPLPVYQQYKVYQTTELKINLTTTTTNLIRKY